MPLFLAPLNTALKIIKLNVRDEVKKHLENLGFIADTNIKVLSSNNGSVIVLIKETRLCLDNLTAHKIIVTVNK